MTAGQLGHVTKANYINIFPRGINVTSIGPVVSEKMFECLDGLFQCKSLNEQISENFDLVVK